MVVIEPGTALPLAGRATAEAGCRDSAWVDFAPYLEEKGIHEIDKLQSTL
jgi:hypothetical protein